MVVVTLLAPKTEGLPAPPGPKEGDYSTLFALSKLKVKTFPHLWIDFTLTFFQASKAEYYPLFDPGAAGRPTVRPTLSSSAWDVQVSLTFSRNEQIFKCLMANYI